jgi:hypothetical protein
MGPVLELSLFNLLIILHWNATQYDTIQRI